MRVFETVAEAFESGKRCFDEMMAEPDIPVFTAGAEYGSSGCPGEFRSRIAFGDNLEYMAALIRNEQMSGKVQLIYVDPPFFSRGKYQASIRLDSEALGRSELIKAGAYDDCWGGDMSRYIEMLTSRLFMMKELLAENGCIWVHLDWHVVHYVKVILDEIFGADNFVNEIIWTYKSGGSSRRSFAKKHDTLLVYGKSREYYFDPLKEKSYNRDYKPYRFRGVEEFCDEKGWYTMVNMKDVWNIDMVGRTSSERNGYATQKPEKLMERIVESCSREGDICADFFAGSGTLGAGCDKLDRKWIMCDAGKLSAACQISRMGAQSSDFVFSYSDDTGMQGGGSAGNGEIEAVLEAGEAVLTDYRISEAEIKSAGFASDVKSMREIEKYLSEDSLSLIKWWSIDENYDGKIHRAEKIITDGRRRCRLGNTCGAAVSIMGCDVLGNMFFRIMDA